MRVAHAQAVARGMSDELRTAARGVAVFLAGSVLGGAVAAAVLRRRARRGPGAQPRACGRAPVATRLWPRAVA